MDSLGDDSFEFEEGNVDDTNRWAPSGSDAARHD